MDSTLVQTVAANPLPGIIVGALIRAGLLLIVVWSVLKWPKGEFATVALWVALTTFVGVLVETLLLPQLGVSALAGDFIQATAEVAVLLAMLHFTHMGMEAALSLVPAYIVVIALAEVFLFD